jgi:hypothetical protein
MRITNAECESILEKVSGSSSPILQKVDELICAIQAREEIEFIDEDEEEE